MNASTVCQFCQTPVHATKLWGKEFYFWSCSCYSDRYEQERFEFNRARYQVAEQKALAKFGKREDVIPERHRRFISNPDMARISPQIRTIVDLWDDYINTNLFIYGPSVRGKSFDCAWLITKIPLDITDRIAWGTPREITHEVIQNNRTEFYKTAKILVLEDIQFATGGEISVLFDIVNARCNYMCHPIWITSNLNRKDLEAKLTNKALCNRLFQVDDPLDRGDAVEIFKA